MNQRFTSPPVIVGIALAISCLACVFSCEDETERLLRSDRIRFEPDMWQTSSALTKGDAAAEPDTPDNTVTELQMDGPGSLYLHTLYNDSIALPGSEMPEPDSLPLTKAAPVRAMYDNFSVSACKYAGSWDGLQSPDFMYDVSVSQSGTPSGDYYWPGSSYKLRFFAYAPKETAYRLSAQAEGIPTLHCTVPQEVEKQKDLLVAASEEIAGNANTAVSLRFHHALTAVRFVCGDDVQAGTIKRITLKNVYSRGDYDLNLGRWSGWEAKTSFSQTLNKATVGGKPVTTEAQTFMMLPQTLPDDAEIEVLFNDGTTDHTLKAAIGGSGKAWPKGKTVTYKISSASISWEYVFKVTDPGTFSYAGGTNTYSVVSYRKSNTGRIEPVAWKAQFSEDGTTWSDQRPDWLTEFTASGMGGDTATTYKATAKAQIGITDNPRTKILREQRPVKGTEAAPYNLSNKTGASTVENTANCYVVDAPGWYSFPLVYGNAIKNGQTNEPAYTSTASGSNILSPFINHLGNGITDPYIENNSGCVPVKAELVWQDEPELVTHIKYDPTDGRIHFEVDKGSICQGNAVIAIKDAGDTVLWSWHIWVTDEDIEKTIEVTNHQNVKYDFMPVLLGWCDGNRINYDRRDCRVRFVMDKQKVDATIIQYAFDETVSFNHPFYQWGRKDPFLPADGYRHNKTWYNKDGIPSSSSPKRESFSGGIECIKNSILKPDVMKGIALIPFLNLWSANNNKATANDDPVIKTIYDPCPVGFSLPAANAYTGFTKTGGDARFYPRDISQINGIRTSVRVYHGRNYMEGWDFYTGKDDTRIFFPYLGARSHWSSELYPISSYNHAYFWLAIPNRYNNAVGACLTIFDNGPSGFVAPFGFESAESGCMIRPVREKQ